MESDADGMQGGVTGQAHPSGGRSGKNSKMVGKYTDMRNAYAREYKETGNKDFRNMAIDANNMANSWAAHKD